MLLAVRIALALSILFLAGCGSSSHAGAAKSGYETRMSAIAPALQADILKERLALENIRVPSAGRRELQQLEQRLRTGLAKLKATTPPANVANEHAALIDAYQALLTQYTALNSAARQKTTDQLRVQAGKLESTPALQEIGTELKAIIAKGYDLGFPAGS